MASPNNISDLEFYILHTTPWIDKLSPLYVKDAPKEVFDEVPVLRQVRRLLEIIRENGGQLKLTARGNLPSAIVKELYEIGVHDRRFDNYFKSIDNESKAPNVSSVRLLMTVAGLVRKQNNILYIVKKNSKLENNPRALLEKLLNTYSTDYNIGYFDLYENNDLHYESALLYLLIAWYGDIWRRISFYRTELIAMQQVPQDDIHWCLKECMDCRIFRRQMVELGFIERDEGDWRKGDEVKIRRTPLFDKLIGIRTPDAPLIFHSNSLMS